MTKIITYSPSTTIALTRACANRCLYCGYRQNDAGLRSFEALKAVAIGACRSGVSEILVTAGEKADQVPSIKSALMSLGVKTFTGWVKKVCDFLLSLDLLPHVNIGLLGYRDLKEIKEVSASMGLMMEGDYGALNPKIQPQKDFPSRIENLEWAGQLKIPFTTGILMGLGETRKDRLRSIETIIGLCKSYGHVQEIILQKYVPNRKSKIPPVKVPERELKEIIDLCRNEIPDVHLQIPVNLIDNWDELLDLGFDDLGGISQNGDLINFESVFPEVEQIRHLLKKKNRHLRKRLPIYPDYYQRGWYSKKVGKVIQKWIWDKDEYRYYTQ